MLKMRERFQISSLLLASSDVPLFLHEETSRLGSGSCSLEVCTLLHICNPVDDQVKSIPGCAHRTRIHISHAEPANLTSDTCFNKSRRHSKYSRKFQIQWARECQGSYVPTSSARWSSRCGMPKKWPKIGRAHV